MSTRSFAATIALLGALCAPPSVAAAAPPAFPDVNAFSPVDPQDYLFPGSADPSNLPQYRVGFSTPDGVECSWPYSTFPGIHAEVSCEGDIPGIPDSVPEDNGPGCAKLWNTGLVTPGSYVFGRHWGACPPFPFGGLHPLNVGQKISASNVTCVVGANSVTACIDDNGNPGFVLQPSGSQVF